MSGKHYKANRGRCVRWSTENDVYEGNETSSLVCGTRGEVIEKVDLCH